MLKSHKTIFQILVVMNAVLFSEAILRSHEGFIQHFARLQGLLTF